MREVLKIETKDPLINYLTRENLKFRLTGGAVVDIYKNTHVKDYDFIYLSTSFLREKCRYEYSSSTADTYTFVLNGRSFTIQMLKTSVEKFDFEVNTLVLRADGETVTITGTDLAVVSLKTMKLIPTNYSFTNKKGARNALVRVAHMQEKGFTIHPITLKSLKRVRKRSLIDFLFFRFNKNISS